LKAKVVVTDYIEPDLKWESDEFARRGVDFEYHQLKFAPNEKVVEATKDADVVVVNMVKITPDIVSAWNKTKVVIRHGVGYDNLDLDALAKAGMRRATSPITVPKRWRSAIALIICAAAW
jgi:D-3-phosphoglycerate dehydrogenase